MVRYVTKEEIAEEIEKIITKSSYSWDNSFLPRLAFDNETAKHPCDECQQKSTDIHFQFNLSCAAGYDEVVYDWNVDLERLYLTGELCKNCGAGEILLHENSPDNPGEEIYSSTGL